MQLPYSQSFDIHVQIVGEDGKKYLRAQDDPKTWQIRRLEVGLLVICFSLFDRKRLSGSSQK